MKDVSAMGKQLKRKLAAKKAAKTRAVNKAQMEYIERVVAPGHRNMLEIQQFLVAGNGDIRLRYTQRGRSVRKLKHSVDGGRLVGFAYGNMLRVLPDGYRQSLTFHPSMWELSEEIQ